MGRITDSVKVLLIINILFYIGSMALGNGAYELFALYFPLNENFHVWQLVTHMFMHDPGSITHILFNMFMLYMFGSQMEYHLGQKKFLFLYFSAGLGATGLQLLFSFISFSPGYEAFIASGFSHQEIITFLSQGEYSSRVLELVSQETINNTFRTFITTSIGASGAVFGLLAAFMILYPNLPLMIIFIPVPIKAKYLIGGYFLLNVFSAVSGVSLVGPANTAYWAHIGGALIGFIMMWYWKKNSFNKHRWY